MATGGTSTIPTASKSLEEQFAEAIVKNVSSAGGKQEQNIDDTVPMFSESTVDLETGEHTIKSIFGIKKLPDGYPNLALKVYEPEEWDVAVRHYVPPVDEHYVFEAKILCEFLIGYLLKDNIWMSGQTGTGKTTLAEQVAARLKIPFIRVNGRGDMESGAIFGQPSMENGNVIWKDGLCTIAAKYGAMFCQDEPTALPAEIAMGYQWLLENGGKIMLTDMPTDNLDEKTVTPEERFRFICCDNTRGLGDESGSFAGTNVWNTATLDRFGTTLHKGYLPKAQEVKLLKDKVEGMTDKLAKLLVQMAGLVRAANNEGELSFTMSPRTLLSWGEKAMMLRCPHRSFRMAFYEKLGAEDERNAVGQMFMTVFGESLK